MTPPREALEFAPTRNARLAMTAGRAVRVVRHVGLVVIIVEAMHVLGLT